MIRFHDVGFGYEPDTPILKNVSLRIESGLTLVLGPNGAGKSTLLRLAAGVEPPDSGRVEIGGFDLWRDEVRARRLLTYLPEHPDLTPYAGLLEIVRLVCRLRGVPESQGRESLERFDLGHLADRTVRTLSKGQRRRAMFAAVQIGDPPVILLDEPLDGMDMAVSRRITEWMGRKSREGSTLLVVSHQIDPFVEPARAAVSFDRGSAAISSLPSSIDEKRLILEKLAGNPIPPEA